MGCPVCILQGQDLLTNAPSGAGPQQLRDLHIALAPTQTSEA